ncbi:MAG: hypothetical protein IT435_04405 [Phycisphaerales bacterium]|nr:hypothetical protein [Phycisphaerales bacterium]
MALATAVVHAPQQVTERGGHEDGLGLADQHHEQAAWEWELAPVIGHAGEEVAELAGFVHGDLGQAGRDPRAPGIPAQQSDPLQPPDRCAEVLAPYPADEAAEFSDLEVPLARLPRAPTFNQELVTREPHPEVAVLERSSLVGPPRGQ